MTITIYNIFNKTIKSKNRLYFYECRLRDFFNKYNLSMQSNLNLIQSGGYILSYKENNIIYSVDVLEINSDNNDNDSEQPKLIHIRENKNNSNPSSCVILSYINKNSLHIDVIETPIKCIKINDINETISNDIIKKKYKYGDIMMKIIIKYAKDNGFKNIELEDRSYFSCLDSENNLKYSLKNVHILTDGYPWYYKYGFKFYYGYNKIDCDNNYKRLMKLKTHNMQFKNFINLINKQISNYSELDNINKIKFDEKIISNIKKIYDKYENDNICLFFKEFTLNYCNIMCLIYEKLFKYLKLDYIDAERMFLTLD